MMNKLAATIFATNRVTIPRWMLLILGLFAYLVLFPLVHGVTPWAISLLTPRYGWTQGRPGVWHMLGLIPVLVGTAGLIWLLVTGLLHFDQVPERVKLELTPPYLLMRGPYALTRNPMYVAELALWLGWAIFYGSIAVFMGLAVLWRCVVFLVPREERGLEARFGDVYLEYKRAVPRWLAGTSRPL